MDRAIAQWLQQTGQPASKLPTLKLPYTIYGHLLLLSQTAFTSPEWKQVKHELNNDLSTLYPILATHLKITHIAINSAIPPSVSDNVNHEEDNILRSPSNLNPIYGDFGPNTASSHPTNSDFTAAFWTTAKQNGIQQTWTPRWTMFSRGNVSEKARLLDLPSVHLAVEEGKASGAGSCAVDLFVGIGYFAFSYLKAGVRVVVGWDLNPWSVEGLRRGAEANGWDEQVGEAVSAGGEARLLVFNEGNENAGRRIGEMRARLPPVRHVNCGLLPTSRASWRTAVEVLDPELGGWVHVHENFAVAEIESRAEDVREAFQGLCGGREVRIDHVNRLKSYAPGVMHCVIDLHVSPRCNAE
ncbi:S-adenosyl-L-methionine-dependent methyltransferase [Neohortaea acidophila]|uniref:tRNA wybutosine-synthesizing protein 2 n=1 Tax=Neohortaea acidophila TaxID=245834 RepID=A0A6A6PRZ3_9PEZI|nr:S-adenosyl-L-methionine-dependent methyltransferase [Neohortaea acidophila]KAF2482898.1 S-adenosyl-L-methionine-dependent methyltransferase [Neohortaea acidophila]